MSGVSRDPVIVVGAGIGGLTCALALLRRGIDVEVYEQAPQLREIGAGVQISANGTRVLHALGLERGARGLGGAAARQGDQALEERAHLEALRPGRGLRSSATARPTSSSTAATCTACWSRRCARLTPQAIRLQARCVGVEQDAGGVTLVLADGRRVRGRLLIGADGVHSAVRESVFGAGRPEFTGCMAWRGVIPAERLPGGMPLAGTNWIGPGRHVVHYPLRRGELLNFVGVVERGDWLIESWTAQGTQGECRADFAGWHPDVQALIEAIETPFKWALMARSAMTRWSEGRVTLLGDACHAALPFLAQGAAMAIEDAFVLAAALAAHGEDHATALARYEAARIPRTTRVVEGSAANTRRFHNPRLADDAGAGDYIASEWSEEKIEQRYDWLFTYNALNVDIR